MTEKQSPSVIVGIDGSQAAIRAAEWAVKEAASRDVPLRLTFVIDSANAPYLDDGIEREYARDSLMKAHDAVNATGEPVKVETSIVEGHLVKELIRLSRSAELICVGSVGIGYFASKLLGSVASELAHGAHCPVAIIRPDQNLVPGEDWVAVVVDGSPGNDRVVETAVEEARLRGAGVLAVQVWRHPLGALLKGAALAERFGHTYEELEDRLAASRKLHPDVLIDSVAVHGGVNEFLARSDGSVRLIVVGTPYADEVARFIGPVGHAVMHHAHCSVLLLRQETGNQGAP